MTTLADSLLEEITRELSHARAEHGQALVRRLEKDTPANRAHVAECSATIDALLDMYLEAVGITTPPGRGAECLSGPCVSGA